jgi:hypothetical protein
VADPLRPRRDVWRLKKRGLVIGSTKEGGTRRYAAQPEADAQ